MGEAELRRDTQSNPSTDPFNVFDSVTVNPDCSSSPSRMTPPSDVLENELNVSTMSSGILATCPLGF